MPVSKQVCMTFDPGSKCCGNEWAKKTQAKYGIRCAERLHLFRKFGKLKITVAA